MYWKAAAVILSSGWLFACAQTPPPFAAPPPAPVTAPALPAPAPTATAPRPNHAVNIRTASCGAMLNLAPDDREAATMFYIGYQASRSGSRTINIGSIASIEDKALNYCATYPDRPIAAAFAQAYSRTRR